MQINFSYESEFTIALEEVLEDSSKICTLLSSVVTEVSDVHLAGGVLNEQ